MLFHKPSPSNSAIAGKSINDELRGIVDAQFERVSNPVTYLGGGGKQAGYRAEACEYIACLVQNAEKMDRAEIATLIQGAAIDVAHLDDAGVKSTLLETLRGIASAYPANYVLSESDKFALASIYF